MLKRGEPLSKVLPYVNTTLPLVLPDNEASQARTKVKVKEEGEVRASEKKRRKESPYLRWKLENSFWQEQNEVTIKHATIDQGRLNKCECSESPVRKESLAR